MYRAPGDVQRNEIASLSQGVTSFGVAIVCSSYRQVSANDPTRRAQPAVACALLLDLPGLRQGSADVAVSATRSARHMDDKHNIIA
jgi:hypothetical protein